MVSLQWLVPRRPWAAAGPQLPVARVGGWPAASMLVLSSGPQELPGLEAAPRVMVLGSSAA